MLTHTSDRNAYVVRWVWLITSTYFTETLSLHYANTHPELHVYRTPFPKLTSSVLTSHPKLYIPYGLRLSGVRSKILYTYLVSPTNDTSCAYLTPGKGRHQPQDTRKDKQWDLALLVCYAARLVVSYRLFKCVSFILFQYWYVTINRTISPYAPLYQGDQESLTAFKSISMYTYLLVVTLKCFWTAVKFSWSP